MTKKRKKEEESTTIKDLGAYIKEIASALALIAFGCALYYYADDISAWFGDLVQSAFNSIFGEPQH
ncbi:MAG: hypothetical protein IJA63_09075 [Akkermansia sp.]|nr:hypothetical protein [Akkermansia sp.]